MRTEPCVYCTAWILVVSQAVIKGPKTTVCTGTAGSQVHSVHAKERVEEDQYNITHREMRRKWPLLLYINLTRIGFSPFFSFSPYPYITRTTRKPQGICEKGGRKSATHVLAAKQKRPEPLYERLTFSIVPNECWMRPDSKTVWDGRDMEMENRKRWEIMYGEVKLRFVFLIHCMIYHALLYYDHTLPTLQSEWLIQHTLTASLVFSLLFFTQPKRVWKRNLRAEAVESGSLSISQRCIASGKCLLSFRQCPSFYESIMWCFWRPITHKQYMLLFSNNIYYINTSTCL